MPKRIQVPVDRAHIVVIGDGGTGKSCLCLRYIHDRFVDDWDPTILDTYHPKKMINDRIIALDITDTAGQTEIRDAFRGQFMMQGEYFILVCSAVKRSTFDAIPGFIREIIEEKEVDVAPVLVFLNKIDLAPEAILSEDPEVYSQVSSDFVTRAECQELCDNYHLPPVICGSAKTKINVTE